MSCFIVSNDHLDAILNFCKVHSGPRVNNFPDGMRFDEELTNIGRQLMQVNIAAFRSAYQGRHCEDLPTEDYQYTRPARVLTPIEFYKAVDCLAYQCCDWPDWDQSSYRPLLESWQRKALHLLPKFTEQYDAAAWSL